MLTEEKKKLTSLGKEEKFKGIIEKLTLDRALAFDEKSYILSTAILFFRYYQKNKKYLSFADISYYIILKYSIKYDDYKPLFDFSINFGFYPLAKSIIEVDLVDKNTITNLILNVRLDDFYKENYIETLEQSIKSSSFLEDSSNEKSYLAPTSFGKSSLIIDYIQKLPDDNQKIVIVVPTKSLLMQTYRMIRKADLKRKILIHDEMYNGESSFIAVFTQERALRLLTKNKIYYDVLVIDESHNLLKKDRNSNRNILIARLIKRNKLLNPNNKIAYLSPLVKDVDNLRVDKEQKITSHSIKFNIKEPEFYEHTNDDEIYKYNRFTNHFYKLENNKSKSLYFKEILKEKNFIYETSPKNIEDQAEYLYEILPFIDTENESIKNIINNLRREVHKDFYIIKYLEKGIIYLHGRIPDLIKEYIENKFRDIKEIKYVVANSVILEGVNLPIDNLIIFSTWGLKGKELNNLIGRVNRLNTIFTGEKSKFSKLLPPVYIFNDKTYSKIHNPIFENYLRSRLFDDEVENPLLSKFKFENLNISNKEKLESERKRVEQIQNNEEFLYVKPENEFDKVKQAFIEADIQSYYSDFNSLIENFIIKKNEIFNYYKDYLNETKVLDRIKYLFIDDLELTDFEFARLENQEARNYYENYIYISRKKSFNERVNSQVEYFNERADSSNPQDRLYYMGETYGNTFKYSEKYKETKKPVYVDLQEKDDISKVNLAIVKLKMEDDFISFKLNKFIVLLLDFELITTDEYNEIIYGTTNEKKIMLTKYGLNINLVSRLEKDNQLANLYLDEYNNLKVKPAFKNYLERLSDFQQFEIERFID